MASGMSSLFSGRLKVGFGLFLACAFQCRWVGHECTTYGFYPLPNTFSKCAR